jgi:hypothetical protein
MPVRTRAGFDGLRQQLTAWAYDPQQNPPTIDYLLATLSDGLSMLDFNFSVLRDSGGDLQEYCLLMLSHRLFHRLWAPGE